VVKVVTSGQSNMIKRTHCPIRWIVQSFAAGKSSL